MAISAVPPQFLRSSLINIVKANAIPKLTFWQSSAFVLKVSKSYTSVPPLYEKKMLLTLKVVASILVALIFPLKSIVPVTV